MKKDLFFFILALLCMWLVMDEYWGDKRISKFVVGIIPETERNQWTPFGGGTDQKSGVGEKPHGFDGYGNVGNLPGGTDKKEEKDKNTSKTNTSLKSYTI
ncbi:hypothetical protein M1I50_19115 [Clostridioides difficile]|nr:hypothetical protein [Clostridioides difficile]MCL0945074.1 hypothetical protein [Clostridioides difficile]MCR1630773.1 hypothetical protein [Clostridioides difficile]MDI2847290.1 hypothetical protein [Clostridioides difficile]